MIPLWKSPIKLPVELPVVSCQLASKLPVGATRGATRLPIGSWLNWTRIRPYPPGRLGKLAAGLSLV